MFWNIARTLQDSNNNTSWPLPTEAAVKVVTVASASSLLVFIIAVCTAVMLFALYRRRKRKNTLHPEEKVPPTTPVEETEPDLENHVYDNEA